MDKDILAEENDINLTESVLQLLAENGGTMKVPLDR